MDKLPKSDLTRVQLKKCVILWGLAAIAILAIALPIFTPNNVSRYEDLEKAAAQKGLEIVDKSRSGLDGIGTFGTLGLKVEDVVEDAIPPTKETMCNSDFTDTVYSSAKSARFTIIVSLRTFFGIEFSQREVQVCMPKIR